MKVVFRVDASTWIGSGHLIRCLTLAQSLRERSAETHFICRAHPGNLVDLVQRNGFRVTVLPAPGSTPDENAEDYPALRGVTEEEDATQTIDALGGDRPDWVIVDHYGLDAVWQKRVRRYAKLMAIDDLSRPRRHCDLSLNQNYFGGARQDEDEFAPTGCRLLRGPRYALLRPEYASVRGVVRRHGGHVGKVLVFFGGSDRHNVTGVALEALSTSDLSYLEVDVVVGVNNPHRADLERQTSARALTTFHGPRPHLADLMAHADLAVGAGGATTWERMCLGLPALVVSMADNQRATCEALAKAQLIRLIGDWRVATATRIGTELKELIGDRERLLAVAREGQLLVDGLGALRVTEALCPTPTNDLRLRPAHQDDISLYFNWANEAEVRRQAFHPEPISWAHHRDWFERKLADSRSRLFVMMAGSLPVGQIRFDWEGDEAVIGYSLDPLVRGRGWAAQLVALGSALLQQGRSVRLRADVKTQNSASRRVFARLGFKQSQSAQAGAGYVSFVRDPEESPAGINNIDSLTHGS